MSAEAYSVPTPTSNGWLSKRYLGVPVVYLAGAVVAALVIVAYLGSKKKNTTGPPSTATAAPVDPYQTLNSTGTVTTSQPVYYVPQNTQNVDPVAVETNLSWQKKVTEYLVSTGKSVGEAQGAVQAYINGQDMTFAQGAMMTDAVTKYGLPPAGNNVGTVAAKPVDYQSIASYKYIGRRPNGGIYGVLQDGTIHEINGVEWFTALAPAGAKYVQE